ncbi:CLUMA_CG015689, isoform A [Clunio marinus]|uniref:CLUMA_CG015689, isoform A n=1 Tax=Clunio marinus TaxID=568069 RepID=A0A1J1IPT0_9DIPT|nr:CLUMA_CG015689, isoform A [Clunio marinus]
MFGRIYHQNMYKKLITWKKFLRESRKFYQILNNHQMPRLRLLPLTFPIVAIRPHDDSLEVTYSTAA